MNYVKEYYKSISSKNGTVACEEVKAIYKRLVREMNRPPKGFQFYFSEEQGEYVINFIESYCKHYQGEHAGEYVRLELFQKAFIQALFGWLEKGTNRRRFREYFFEVEGFKHTKQFEVLKMCFADEGGSQCGFCTPGMIFAAHSLLSSNSHPSEEEVREALSGNLCRCTGYQSIVHAILRASKEGEGLW